MPRTKGSKNRVTASTDFDAQIAKLQKDKEMLEEGLSKTVAHIEELKKDIKSLREGLKPQKTEIKQDRKENRKLEGQEAAAEAKAAEAAGADYLGSGAVLEQARKPMQNRWNFLYFRKSVRV